MRGFLLLALITFAVVIGPMSVQAKSSSARAKHSQKMTKKKQKGMASWYGPNHHGKRTASGEPFNMNALTAAHRTLPLGSRVKVKSLSTGKSVIVRINDRGPFSKGRIIDVSKAAAKKLGFLKKGTDRVEVTVVSAPGKKVAAK